MRPFRFAVLALPLFIAAVYGRIALYRLEPADYSSPNFPAVTYDGERGWHLRVVREMPEDVNALLVPSKRSRDQADRVFVGTAPMGGVYHFNPILPITSTAIASGLGDRTHYGTSPVTRLAEHDLDGDGEPELLATTSQILPEGRPRLYAWSPGRGDFVLRGVARPDIRSNWSHGIAVVDRGGGPRILVTFCGYGEVVEYRLLRVETDSGGSIEGLDSKVVTRLPHSGEWIQAADVDNDGQAEICVATGYAEGGAAILIYASDAPGAAPRLEHRIDESGRFGNVRFLSGDLRGDGSQELVAWWCTDHLYGGDCEVIHYRLGPGGVVERRILGRDAAGKLWPDDGQATLADTDGDDRPEVWFCTKAGPLWCYDPSHSPSLIHVLRVRDGLGPIAGGTVGDSRTDSLFLGSGRRVLRLDRRTPARAGDRPS